MHCEIFISQNNAKERRHSVDHYCCWQLYLQGRRSSAVWYTYIHKKPGLTPFDFPNIVVCIQKNEEKIMCQSWIMKHLPIHP